MQLGTSGTLQLNSLIGSGNRLLQTDVNGKIIPFMMGSSSQVLYGNGVWGALPTIPTSLWSNSGPNLYYNGGFVGIGTSHPTMALDVVGDARVSNNLYVGGGIIITEKVNASNEVKTAAIVADSIKMDSTKAVYGKAIFENEVKLKQKLNVDGDVIISGATEIHNLLTASSINTGNLNTTNFNVSSVLNANKITAYRITAAPGDSVIRLGDSTILVYPAFNRFAPSPTTVMGSPSYTVAGMSIGHGTIAKGVQSLALGTTLQTDPLAFRSIVIGSGTSAGPLVNDKRNSLMIGFNSTVPTVYVSESSPIGETGAVGIATTYIPMGFKLAVNGKIIAEELNIKLRSGWPDYVFSKNYNLLPLAQLENYVSENHHLPEIPNAKEMEQNGINTSEMITKLIKKQEELTLYIIEQNKRIEVLEEKQHNQ
jgi:hypothetical protein